MEQELASIAAAAGVAALMAAGQLAVLRARLRRRPPRPRDSEIRRVLLVGPHAPKIAHAGMATFTLGAVAHVRGYVLGLFAMVFGLLLLGFAASHAIGLRMVEANDPTGDPSVASAPRHAWRDAVLLGAGVALAGGTILVGTRDAARLLWLVPVSAAALVAFAIVRAYAVRVPAGKDAP